MNLKNHIKNGTNLTFPLLLDSYQNQKIKEGKGNCPINIILSFLETIENNHGQEIHIKISKECENIVKHARKYDEHYYHIEYNHNEYEIVCPEYRKDSEAVIILPYYLLPGRKYPISVYLYAISLYSSNPDMGQREAAEKTRKKFNLEKFSHTTLGRSFKALEKSVNEIIEQDKAVIPEIRADIKRFPTVHDTFNRRKKLAAFLGDLYEKDNISQIDIQTRKIVKSWYDKHKRLLL